MTRKRRVLGAPAESKLTKNFNLVKDIKKGPLYGRRSKSRHDVSYNALYENCESVSNIVPGQLIMFNYFSPITKEELEYYDATPCTLYFGVHNTEQGKRVVGFNLHYYPVRMRYNILSKIFDIFSPIFKKYWDEGIQKEVDGFDYRFLINELQKARLEFGIRQYDPKLMGKKILIPPKWFATAVFTEGNFKKQTRASIMKYWKNWKPS